MFGITPRFYINSLIEKELKNLCTSRFRQRVRKGLQGLRDVVYRLQKSEFERSRRLQVRL